MRAFIKQVLLFVLIATLAYPVLLVGASLAYKDGGFGNVYYAIGYYGNLWTRVRDRSVEPPADVLVIGSSLAYRGCDPRVFQRNGLRMFNLGSSAQTPAQSEVLLKHHWDRLRPHTVVMIVTPDIFTSEGIESALDVIANDRVDPATVQMALRTGSVKVLNTVIYASARQALNLDADFIEPSSSADDGTYVPGGYMMHSGTGFTAKKEEPPGLPIVEQLDAFRRSMAFIEQRGARVILVYPPVTACCRPGPDTVWAEDTWREAGPYYDMSTLYGDTVNAYFSDGRHQNQAGAERFSQVLIDRLRQAGFLNAP